MISKNDVPSFSPTLNAPFLYKKDLSLKKFLLTKLINAEYASLRAPAFSQFSEKTIEHSLNKLYDDLYQMSLTFTWLGDNLSFTQAYCIAPNLNYAHTSQTPPTRSGGSFFDAAGSVSILSNDGGAVFKDFSKEREKDAASATNISQTSGSKFSFKNAWRRFSVNSNGNYKDAQGEHRERRVSSHEDNQNDQHNSVSVFFLLRIK